MTIMAHRVALKEQPWPRGNSSSHKNREVIHSGHFMVSHFEAEAQDDEDELAVPVPEGEDEGIAQVRTLFKIPKEVSRKSLPLPQLLPIETSLSKLFQCMSLAYRQKLTSPKWNRFKGIRLRWKDKIRLNNVIWRCWHMQFINKQKTLVCQFASPLDVDTHNKPEAVVLEGKYWKRKLNAVTAEYKKWRMFYHHKILGRPTKEGLDMLAEFEGPDWQIHSSDNSMMVDEDYMGLMTDTLFTTIAANQPYAFPDSREIARGANLADFIQPSLVQLQPNLDELMDFEPLHDFFYSSKLTSVPEEQGCLAGAQSLDLVQSYQSTIVKDEDPLGNAYEPYQPAACSWFAPPSNSSQVACVQPSSQISTLHHFKSPSYNPPPPPPPPLQSTPIPPLPPPLPPLPSQAISKPGMDASSKPEVFAVPKSKPTKGGKGRARSSASSKKNILPNNNILPNPMQQQEQSNPSNILAQLLTNTSSSTYSFIGNDQQLAQIHKVPNLGNRPVEVPYIQPGYSSNSFVYPIQSDTKSEPYSTSDKASSSRPSPSVSPKLQSSVLVSSVPSLPSSSSSSVCPPDSPGPSEQLSLSPLSVGSPASPSTKFTGFKEHRRVYYNNAEQKRRCNIKNGFDTLHSLIPHLNQSPNAKMSKAVMLQKGADYIQQLRSERAQLRQEMEGLRQQIEALNTSISNCQSMLPASGAPVTRHRNSRLKEMFQNYVRMRTHESWKFWILSLIFEPLLESFSTNVSNASLEDFYRTTLQWVDQHCSLIELRPIVLNALRHLCATTDVLCDPSKLPREAKAAVEKQAKRPS